MNEREPSPLYAVLTSTSWLGAVLLALAACRSQNDVQLFESVAADSLQGSAERVGWFSWRGPAQDGTSPERQLPDSWTGSAEDTLWTLDVAGRGTPAIDGDRVYVLAYEGEEDALREKLFCLDARNGQVHWERSFRDFLSDVIYDRYAIGAPAVDPETGNVFVLTAPGLLVSFTPDGTELWQRSTMSEFGRLTFPNGRIGSPLIDGERVIIHVISTSWGPLGPARDRFYAFDKESGECMWVATPGEGPKDSSFSYPVLAEEHGRRVLYAGTGCGNIVCIDARTGDSLWRYKLATGGVNSNVLVYGDDLIAIHGKENVDTSTIGRMISLKRGAEVGAEMPRKLDKSFENWRNDLVAFTSSPTMVGDRIYQTVYTGELCCIDASSGEVLWEQKLAPDQIHASPTWGDGKLYVPMTNGSFFIVKPTDEGPEILSEAKLEGSCLGAPAIAGGRIYVHTTKRLYCFGSLDGQAPPPPSRPEVVSQMGTERLRLLPSEAVLRQGESLTFRVDGLDKHGATTDRGAPSELAGGPTGVEWSGLTLSAPADMPPGVGMVEARSGDLVTKARVRVVPNLPYAEDFGDIKLAPSKADPQVLSAFPPAAWINAKLKWEVLEREGEPVLAKTLTNPLFQRTMTFFGDPEASNYTMQVDILTDGNRRGRSSAGLVHQRYLILLKGNHQQLEVSSNFERLKVGVPFRWKSGTWYRLLTRVDVDPEGNGMIRAKAWPREEPEPESWTLEVPHEAAHTQGAPGLYGFTPQNRFRVYLDNLVVTPNE